MVRAVGAFGVIRWDGLRWHHEPPISTWVDAVAGPFDAVVSSIAIHNVREHATIRSIYGEIFNLLNPGGCFLNLDRMRPSVNEQLGWLREAGYQRVQQFWDSGKRAIVGGFRQSQRK
jgi:SAM-dependent methyltransferase